MISRGFDEGGFDCLSPDLTPSTSPTFFVMKASISEVFSEDLDESVEDALSTSCGFLGIGGNDDALEVVVLTFFFVFENLCAHTK